MAVSAYKSLGSLTQALDHYQSYIDNGRIFVDEQQVKLLQNKVHFSFLLLESLPHQMITSQVISLAQEMKKLSFEVDIILNNDVLGQLRRGGYGGCSTTASEQKPSVSVNDQLACAIQIFDLLINCLTSELISYLQKGLDSIKACSPNQPREDFDIEIGDIKGKVQRAEAMITEERAKDKYSSLQELLKQLVQNFESYNERGLKIDESNEEERNPGQQISVVGIEDTEKWVIEALTSNEKSLQIIAIVGMSGVGKTTLAGRICQDKKIKRHFDIIRWHAVSQKYDQNKMLLDLLKENQSSQGNRTLGGRLNICLSSRRYLIVLDNVKSMDTLNDVRLHLPTEREGSRIIITTQDQNLSNSIQGTRQCRMSPLDFESSWNLFNKVVFKEKECPIELEASGRKIVKDCKGLPLSLVTVGGLLSKDTSVEFWKNIASNMRKTAAYEDCKEQLRMSYNYLPIHLKACSLGLEIYAKANTVEIHGEVNTFEIQGEVNTVAFELIRNCWVKPINGRNILDVANDYLKDLAYRNLIVIGFRPVVDSYEQVMIHDLLLDLRDSESSKEVFIEAPRFLQNIEGGACRMCDLSSLFVKAPRFLQKSEGALEKLDIISFMIHDDYQMTTLDVCRKCKQDYSHLIKSVKFIHFKENGDDLIYSSTTRHACIKSATLRSSRALPILYLWNLQTLYISEDGLKEVFFLPDDIYEMKCLFMIEAGGFILPKPKKKGFTLDKLQSLTIGGVEEFYECAPNMKALVIQLKDDGKSYALNLQRNISGFHGLDILVLKGTSSQVISWESNMYPSSLKILTLESTKISAEDFNAIGSLPNLEYLQLKNCMVSASQWRCQFRRLKTLKLHSSQIDLTNTESNLFPCLEVLHLTSMKNTELPSWMMGIQCLRFIYLAECERSLDLSAVDLALKQVGSGNRYIELYIDNVPMTLYKFEDSSEEEEEEEIDTPKTSQRVRSTIMSIDKMCTRCFELLEWLENAHRIVASRTVSHLISGRLIVARIIVWTTLAFHELDTLESKQNADFREDDGFFEDQFQTLLSQAMKFHQEAKDMMKSIKKIVVVSDKTERVLKGEVSRW